MPFKYNYVFSSHSIIDISLYGKEKYDFPIWLCRSLQVFTKIFMMMTRVGNDL